MFSLFRVMFWHLVNVNVLSVWGWLDDVDRLGLYHDGFRGLHTAGLLIREF